MATYTVNDRSAFLTALTKAVAGDTIVLGAADYGDIVISGKKYASQVSIVSGSTTGMPHFSTLKIENSSNILVKGIDIGGATNVLNATYKATVTGSSGITFDGLHVHGTMDGDPTLDSNGIRVLSSSNVTVRNSEFEQLLRGIWFQRSSSLNLVGNKFHDIRMDGSVFSAVQKVLIDSNTYTNFYRQPEDHSDAIQFWSMNETVSSTDITITNNQILQGSGTSMQGIFFNEEVGTLPYKNVTIANNLIYEKDYANGIMLTNVQGASLSGNTVVSPNTDTTQVWIRLKDVSGASLSNNVTDHIKYEGTTANVATSNNTVFTSNPLAATLISGLNLGATAQPWQFVTSGTGYQLLGTGSALNLFSGTTTTTTSTTTDSTTLAPSTLSDTLLTSSTSTTSTDTSGSTTTTTSGTTSTTDTSTTTTTTTTTSGTKKKGSGTLTEKKTLSSSYSYLTAKS